MNKNNNYVALHNHSHYSVLDGFSTIDEYVKAAKDSGMIGIGLTDHGTASGLYEFIVKASHADLIPIAGLEFYVAPENPEGAKVRGPVYYGKGGMKAQYGDVPGNGAYTHMTVFAKNKVGLQNIFKLTSMSWQPEHYYFKPRIDTNMLAEYSEGLIVTTGCPSSEVNRRFMLGQDDKAYEYASRLKSIFKDDFYVEIMDHDMKDELERNLTPKLIKLARDLDIKLIGTNDSHYAFKEDAETHERILAIQTDTQMSTPSFNDGGTRFAFSGPEYYVKPYDEMLKCYPEDIAEEVLANTIEIAEKCKGVTMGYDPHLRPEIEVPEGYTAPKYLQKLIMDGMKRLRKNDSPETKKESVRRAKHEFEVIHSNDFVQYFLVVHDYINWAVNNGVHIGTGRGSVGGSEIAFLLGISKTDPIKYDLLFERFLSPGRGSLYNIELADGYILEDVQVSAKHDVHQNDGVIEKYTHELIPGDAIKHDDQMSVISEVIITRPGSAPDVDTDFDTVGRERVIEYCSQKYGHENVAQIITKSIYKTKSAFKAVCRAYGIPPALSNKITKAIPDPIEGKDISFDELTNPSSSRYAEGEEFRQLTQDGDWPEIIHHAQGIAGRISHTGVHPCFVAGTSIKTSDGYKAIEDIKIGDSVLTHKGRYQDVADTMITLNSRLYNLDVEGETLTLVTGNHPIYAIEKLLRPSGEEVTMSNPKWVNVEDLDAEVHLVGTSNEDSTQIVWKPIISIYETDEYDTTYNLSVVDDNSYIANNLIAHNCGVVIGNQPLSNIVPVQVRQNDGALVTQWTYPELESLGLIKMDFLGLETVDIIYNTVTNIKESQGIDVSVDEIIAGDLDDKKVYELLQSGDTVGIFQLAGEGVRNLLMRAKPTKFMDIATITALYRPGPMSTGAHLEWADRLTGTNEVEPIHPDLAGTAVEEVLNDTMGLVVFQESLMKIATDFAGMTPYESETLRKAMGKKNMQIMMSLQPKFIEGSMTIGGVSEEAAYVLWDTLEGFGQYGFNKCAHGGTLISTPDGKVKLSELYKRHLAGEDIEVHSMFPDGEIKFHKVAKVVKTGRKPLYHVKTQSGRKIQITKDHRLLTTEGYGTIEGGEIAVGKELIIDNQWSSRLKPSTIATRKANMSAVNQTSEMREASRVRMIDYQSTLTFEDRSAHQKMVSATTDRNEKLLPLMKDRLAELRKDPEWAQDVAERHRIRRQEQLESGDYIGFGRPTQLSDGRFCDSMAEARAGEYLIKRGIEFEMHKPIVGTNGNMKFCDFYVDGLYFEMDGLNRGREYFVEHKYGDDIPFVYMTPQDFGDVIDEAIMSHHIENGDPIIEIVEPKISKAGKQYTEMSYDIEMDTSGPANFIADGIVSHNSHSVSYAINAYVALWLKAHYPAEFMASVLQSSVSDPIKVATHLEETIGMGLVVGPVDINSSRVNIAASPESKDYDIVYGFSGVKQVNDAISAAIVAERDANGAFSSPAEFVERVHSKTPMNSGALSSLAHAGAFDCFGVSRKLVAQNASDLLRMTTRSNSKGAGISLFALAGQESAISESLVLSGDEYGYNEKIQRESDAIGLFVSGHPTSNLGHIKTMYNAQTINAIANYQGRLEAPVIGTFTTLASKINRRGTRSIAVTLNDGESTVPAYLSRELVSSIDKREELERIESAKRRGVAYNPSQRSMKLQELVYDDSIEVMDVKPNLPYVVSLSKRFSNGAIRYNITSVEELITDEKGRLPFVVRATDADVEAIKSIAKRHEGNQASIRYIRPDGTYDFIDISIKLSIELIVELEKLLGYENMVTEGI